MLLFQREAQISATIRQHGLFGIKHAIIGERWQEVFRFIVKQINV